jgi:hypothetical protein
MSGWHFDFLDEASDEKDVFECFLEGFCLGLSFMSGVRLLRSGGTCPKAYAVQQLGKNLREGLSHSHDPPPLRLVQDEERPLEGVLGKKTW